MTFRAERLSVRYDGSQPLALDGVSLQVPEGTLYAALGPNGSGKSTLMRTLMGLIPREEGTVEVAGKPLEGWTRRELAQRVGAVPQSEHVAFPLTVRDLVSMGRYPHLGPLGQEGRADGLAIEAAMIRCDIQELASRNVTTLSGGETQRVRIARALAQDPSSLILDEPTASLDIRHEMTIFRLLRELADKGTTVLLITHNINLAARFADRFLLLNQGRVEAEGGHDDVFTEEILKRVYRWPVNITAEPASGLPQVTPLLDPRE